MSNGQGSVALDKRIKTWNLFFYEDGKRHCKRLGTKTELTTKTAAKNAARTMLEGLRKVQVSVPTPTPDFLTVSDLVEQYRQLRMPQRHSTRRGYNAWLNNHVLPRWGTCAITEVKAQPVEMWLQSLPLTPKSREAIRSVIAIVWDFAMWSEAVPGQRNPMELVEVKGSSKRRRKPRSLTVEEFKKFTAELREPFRTIGLVTGCLGLRISECLGLRWSDVDWLGGKLKIERAIVRQHVDEVKTEESRQDVTLAPKLIDVLKLWKQTTQFSAPGDWMFASPVRLGRLPWSYPQVWNVFQKAAADAGVGKVGTHTMRHSYRTWIGELKTPLEIQQRLMRHTDIRTTMSYGETDSDEMIATSRKVAKLTL